MIQMQTLREKNFSRPLEGVFQQVFVKCEEVIDPSVSGEMEARIVAVLAPNDKSYGIIQRINSVLDEAISYYKYREYPFDFISCVALVDERVRKLFLSRGFKIDAEGYWRLNLR